MALTLAMIASGETAPGLRPGRTADCSGFITRVPNSYGGHHESRFSRRTFFGGFFAGAWAWLAARAARAAAAAPASPPPPAAPAPPPPQVTRYVYDGTARLCELHDAVVRHDPGCATTRIIYNPHADC